MKSGKTVKIGFVGVGAISGIYLENITKKFDNIDVIGVCDLIRERAENAVKPTLNGTQRSGHIQR